LGSVDFIGPGPTCLDSYDLHLFWSDKELQLLHSYAGIPLCTMIF